MVYAHYISDKRKQYKKHGIVLSTLSINKISGFTIDRLLNDNTGCERCSYIDDSIYVIKIFNNHKELQYHLMYCVDCFTTFYKLDAHYTSLYIVNPHYGELSGVSYGLPGKK
jgi:hypothetical protein